MTEAAGTHYGATDARAVTSTLYVPGQDEPVTIEMTTDDARELADLGEQYSALQYKLEKIDRERNAAADESERIAARINELIGGGDGVER